MNFVYVFTVITLILVGRCWSFWDDMNMTKNIRITIKESPYDGNLTKAFYMGITLAIFIIILLTIIFSAKECSC